MEIEKISDALKNLHEEYMETAIVCNIVVKDNKVEILSVQRIVEGEKDPAPAE